MLEKTGERRRGKRTTFWQQFGLVLKEGPAEDFANQEAIAKLLRFASTYTDSSAQTVSLEDERFPHERRAGENLLHH